MEPQTQSPSVSSPVSSSDKKRRTLLIVIILLAIIAIGWFVKGRLVSPVAQTPSSGLSDAQKQSIISQVATDSSAVQVSSAKQAAIVKEVASTSSTAASGKTKITATPTLTDAQKEAILQSISSTSAK